MKKSPDPRPSSSLQLPLAIQLRESARYANYYPGPNRAALEWLKEDREPFVYLWGGPGTGKTHLLHAACHDAAGHGAVAYVPLATVKDQGPAVLEGLERLALVTLDDVHVVLGEGVWETALFHFHNRLREAGGRLLVTASLGPRALPVVLLDLHSRLTSALVVQLRALNDEDKAAALRLHAHRRGVDLAEDAAGYLLRHCPRDMGTLFALLDGLDRASLAAQRRLTLPFVKAALPELTAPPEASR